MSLPQHASTRYVSNLLNRGRNDDFNLVSVTQENAIHDGIVVGSYYTICIRHIEAVLAASGVTPSQAARRCMKKFGVTFRE
jgi:hypothetical protein